MELKMKNGLMNFKDYKTFEKIVQNVEYAVYRGHGGMTEEDGTDWVDWEPISSKEEIEEAIEFLQALLPWMPTEEMLYGHDK